MSNPRYPEEFKIEAVRQVTERGLPVAEVASRLGMSTHSLYAWVKRYSKPEKQRVQEDEQQAELRRLRAELKRVTEERDILKKAAVSSTGECNILHLSQNWAFTHGNDEGARVLSFTKARALA
tara:strand:- start:932 stop:1300 length:369 start_codon:yes stop_codon:yes gene_type:complete